MGEVDVTMVVKRVRDGYNANKTRPIACRRKILGDLLRMIDEKEQDFIEAMRLDLRKARFESLIGELDFVKNEIINTLNHLDEWAKPQMVQKGLHMIGTPTYIQYQPFGTMLIFGAWNYPFQVTVGPLVGAIAAGNTAVMKPSELSSEFSKTLARIVPQYLDPDCVQVVIGGVEVATALLKEKYDHIVYTGSGNVGRIVMAAAAKHLTPVTLELGGKSPCFIDDGIDLEVAVHRLMWAKLMNNGQTCIAPDYVICRPSLNEKLIRTIAKTVKEFYGENPKDSPDYGRIINDRHFQRVMNLTKSGRIVVGGESDPSQRYIAPTVLVDVTDDDLVMQEEIFGPVLPIINVDNIDEAIGYINRKPKPLTLYVMSSSKKVVKRFTEETSSGSFMSNDFFLQASCDTLPFGGVGESGMGAYHGRFSFEMFSHKRACVLGKLGMEKLLSMRYPPFTDKNLGILRWIMRKNPKRGPLRSLISLALLGAFAGLLFMVLHSRYSQ